MNIALLRQRVSAPGGAETTVLHLSRGLIAAGHRVTVYGAEPEAAARAVLDPQVGYVPVPVWGGKTGRLLSYALNTRRLLRRDGPQVVFSLERTAGAQVYRAGDGCHLEWLQRRTPFLSTAGRWTQNISLFHQLMLLLERRLFTGPGLLRVIANSRQVQEEIIRHYRVDPDRIAVIYNGLDHQAYQPLNQPERAALQVRLGAPARAPIILFAGSGFRRKGLAFLLEAMSALKDRSTILWVVGKGNPALYLRQARQSGLEERLKFWGPQPDLATFYQAATVIALPTIYDPCSNVVLEALCCGTPVLTTAANGAREFLTPGENGGILSQPDDLAGLTGYLEDYLTRGEAPEVRRAAADAVAHLSWDTTVSQTLEVLEAAADSGKL